MKKVAIISFVLGGLIFGSISAIAATTYSSNLILYKGSSGDKPLNEALDELYPLKSKGNATASDIVAGKTAVVQGKIVTGTMQSVKKIVISSSTFKSLAANTITFNIGQILAQNNITGVDLASLTTNNFLVNVRSIVMTDEMGAKIRGGGGNLALSYNSSNSVLTLQTQIASQPHTYNGNTYNTPITVTYDIILIC